MSGLTGQMERVAKMTTTENLFQMVRTSGLQAEEQLAIVAFRQLSIGEILQAVEKLKELIPKVGASNGKNCGKSCGDGCGNECGHTCGFTCDHKVTSSGVFCGSGCMVRPGSIGIINQAGVLSVNFREFDVQTFTLAVQKLIKLTP
jgi:hypothetical protein